MLNIKYCSTYIYKVANIYANHINIISLPISLDYQEKRRVRQILWLKIIVTTNIGMESFLKIPTLTRFRFQSRV